MRAICVPFCALLLLVASTAAAGVFRPGMDEWFDPKPQQLALPRESAPVPGADDAIAAIPTRVQADIDPTFASSGLEVGDVGPSVALRTLDGAVATLPEPGTDRPVLVVTVSLTCPIARSHIADASRIAARFADVIDVRLVYVVEAHPVVDPSPYTGAEWPSGENTAAGILYRQPMTMGERTALALILRDRFSVTLPMLVDGPENTWWGTYGPAPNQAVLLAPDGTVLVEHGWFNGDGADMEADIVRALGVAG